MPVSMVFFYLLNFGYLGRSKLSIRIGVQGCHEVLKVFGPSGPVTDNFKCPRSNSGSPKQNSHK